MYGFRFLKEFIAHPATVGAVTASSKSLARVVVDAAHVSEGHVVVEFGPGTGAITETVLQELPPDATFFSLEINADFVDVLRRRFPSLTVYNDSAANTRTYLEKHGFDSCDSIVSGLPWAAFNEDLQDTLLDAVGDCLRPGGWFATYGYLQSAPLPAGRRLRQKLRERFGGLSSSHVVWKNTPPAIVYYVRKPQPEGASA